jgi:hypothetical protein
MSTVLCDGIPRALCPISTPTVRYVREAPTELVGELVASTPAEFPISPPKCDIEPIDRNRLRVEIQSSYKQRRSLAKAGPLFIGCRSPNLRQFLDLSWLPPGIPRPVEWTEAYRDMMEQLLIFYTFNLSDIPITARRQSVNCRNGLSEVFNFLETSFGHLTTPSCVDKESSQIHGLHDHLDVEV